MNINRDICRLQINYPFLRGQDLSKCSYQYEVLPIFDLPTEFQSIRKVERVLIPKRILFEKVTVLPRGQMEKITGTICNVPVDHIDISNILPRTADSTGLAIVKLKCKFEYGGHVLFQAVRPAFLCNILYYLKIIICIKVL